MNFKLFKKIIINLLKFVQILLSAFADLFIKVEDILIDLIIKLEEKELNCDKSLTVPPLSLK